MSSLETSPHFKIIKDVEATTLFSGAFGTQINKISNYTFNGVFPVVGANAEMLVVAPATHVALGDSVFVTVLGVNGVPAGLTVGNAYVAATDVIVFKIANFTPVPYTSGGAYTASFLVMSFAQNI